MKRISLALLTLCFLLGIQVKTNSQVFDSPPRDGIYDKVHTPNRKPIPYVPIREADVVWTKRIWRVIDLRQKINHPFYFPEKPYNQWRSFTQVLLDGLKEGSITAYEVSNTDEFNTPLTYQDIMSRLNTIDSSQQQRPDPPYDWYDTVIVKEFNPIDVRQIRLKEDWFFDKQRSVQDVRIIGICPVVDDVDDNGEYKGTKPLFWIYFPEARPLFAKTEVFNRFNDAERRTFDDLFWKRFFGSYVIKESNVYDRKISDYSTGLNALMESDRVKNDLFTFEHDLWEF
jgi:gliding motility associated protien GldN